MKPSKIKLAIITTHPIQYNAPVFRLLSERDKVNVKVFYTAGEQSKESKFDIGFGKTIKWDLPLTEGYDFCFVPNIAKEPGSHHYKGIDNPSLNKEIESWGAEALLVFGWKLKSHLKAIRYFKGRIPVIFRGDSTLLDPQPFFKRTIRRYLLTWVYSNVDYALYVGKNNRHYYLNHGLKESQLVHAPHAVDNDRFGNWTNDNQRSLAIWKADLGIKEDDFVVLFAGKLIHKKNPRFLLTLGTALKGMDNIKFLLVGNGVMGTALKEQVKDDTRYLFLDFQNQTLMPMIYRIADVFILPSFGPAETWGLAINEAMACGLPVIASDRCGGAIDLIEEGKNGVLFAVNDTDKVSSYVKRLYDSLKLRESTASNAQRHIKNFSFAKIAASIEHVLDNNQLKK